MTTERLAEKYDDNWPIGSIEEFIWERCEADNTRVREIMGKFDRLILEARKEELETCGSITQIEQLDRISELDRQLGKLNYGM